jgi:hypothetical protein
MSAALAVCVTLEHPGSAMAQNGHSFIYARKRCYYKYPRSPFLRLGMLQKRNL